MQSGSSSGDFSEPHWGGSHTDEDDNDYVPTTEEEEEEFDEDEFDEDEFEFGQEELEEEELEEEEDVVCCPPGLPFFLPTLAVSDLPSTMLQPLPGTNRCFYSGDEVLLVNRLPDLVDSEVVRGLDVDSWTGVIAVCVHPSVLIGCWFYPALRR